MVLIDTLENGKTHRANYESIFRFFLAPLVCRVSYLGSGVRLSQGGGGQVQVEQGQGMLRAVDKFTLDVY